MASLLLSFFVFALAMLPTINACRFTMQIRQECIASRGSPNVTPVTYASINSNPEVSLERDRNDIWPGKPLTVHSYYPKGFVSFTYGACNFDEHTAAGGCGSCKATSAWAPGDWKCEPASPSDGSRVKNIECDFAC